MRKLTFPVLFVLLAACTKEVNSDLTVPVNGGEQSDAIIDTYLPLTAGTYWDYSLQTDNQAPGKSKLTVLSVHKNFDGKKYTAVQSIRGKYNADTLYYNQTQHSYYIYTNEGTSNSDAVKVQILFLKDNASVGDTWSQSAGSANGQTLTCYGQIKEKNISVTVNGVTFDHVIHTYIEIRKPILFFYVVVYKQNYYVAKNIGIIKNISNQLQPSNSTTTSTIINYAIK
jgi:hypothetical protein